MYVDQLEVKTVDVDSIFLDPNNPRFWTEHATRELPDSKIPDDKVQSQARNQIATFGIEDLSNSILRNGFLNLDRMVVRPLDGHAGKYVVVEGNRRFAALTQLRKNISDEVVQEEGITEEALRKLHEDTEHVEVLIYKGTGAHDISWILQGIRHIGGIRPWDPAQRARLVAQQIDNAGLSFRAAGQRFGLSAQAVGRLYRAYKALMQMRDDDDFGDKARNEYFSLFEEAYRQSTIREWLGWNEETTRFEKQNNLKKFYSWIIPDEDAENKRRIHDPHQLKDFAYLLNNENAALIDEVDRHELSIDEAYGRATASPQPQDWRASLAEARRLISDVPQSAITSDTDDFVAALNQIAEVIQQSLKMAEAVRNA